MDDSNGMIKIGPAGSERTIKWDDRGRNKITTIFIWCSESNFSSEIEAIQYQYVDEHGKLVFSELHGRQTKEFHAVKLDYPSERITGIEGIAGGRSLSSISVVTNLRTYGPYGESSGHSRFVFDVGEVGFGGFYGSNYRNGQLSSLGVYIKIATAPVSAFPMGIKLKPNSPLYK